MRRSVMLCTAALALLPLGHTARAAGELNIYNWGDYTNPELIEKFEKQYNIDVTITDYDSNDTALAKVKAGGHGFDIVVPSAQFIPVWVADGLLLEAGPTRWRTSRTSIPAGSTSSSIPAATTPCRGSGASPASRSTPTTTRATSTPGA